MDRLKGWKKNEFSKKKSCPARIEFFHHRNFQLSNGTKKRKKNFQTPDFDRWKKPKQGIFFKINVPRVWRMSVINFLWQVRCRRKLTGYFFQSLPRLVCGIAGAHGKHGVPVNWMGYFDFWMWCVGNHKSRQMKIDLSRDFHGATSLFTLFSTANFIKIKST